MLVSKSLTRIVPAVVLAAYCVIADGNSTRPQIRAPGWGELNYVAPAPGTYLLPVIKIATDGQVLRSDNSAARLFDLMGDRLVLLSFIYTRCSDVNGCPLANAVLYKVQSRLSKRPKLTESVRLLSVSIDPEYDTTVVTGDMERLLRKEDSEWEFLTTSSRSDLQPILNGYGQYAIREFDEHGEQTDQYAHLLRVYLIDREKQIRNIYSVSFLHPDILMNDLETLILESSVD